MKNLFTIVLLLTLMYLLWSWGIKNTEGFTSGKTPKDIYAKIQSTNTSFSDILNITTYRDSYESMVEDLQKWADHSMLNLLAQGKIGTEATDTSADSVKLFNDLALFKKNVADFMEIVDKMN
jgi:hypothetical protein